MSTSYRSHHCGELNASNADQSVVLSGWVHSIRDHGGVIFIMLRDQHGLTQIVSSKEIEAQAFEITREIRNEYVLQIEGTVRKRDQEAINPKIPTGSIEIPATKIKVLNRSDLLPFEIDQNTPVKDEGIRYRYLHLRRPEVKEFILKRYEVTRLVRNFFDEQGFVEIETPLLSSTTPEGARNFLVPSRSYPGEFYALPQSPQQYKQLLMISAFDRYFQIAKALRDEDSRADRQLEHTQIDFEMSFVQRDDLLKHLESMFTSIVKNIFPHRKLIAEPFPRMTFQECMMHYGTDKPDLRFDLLIKDVTDCFKATEFKIFAQSIASNHRIKAIKVSRQANLSRKQLDDLIVLALDHGLKGLVWVTYQEVIKSSIGKSLSPQELEAVQNQLQVEKGDLVLIAADQESVLLESLGNFRLGLGKKFNLIQSDLLGFAFVVDFPLFDWNEEEQCYNPLHHMFVKPKDEDIPLLDQDPQKVMGTQFDVICNGYEICSGSERIYTSELQRKVMRLIGLKDEEIDLKFGHILQAFDFGAPPHGGAAPGLDRLIMVLMNTPNIRDVVAFPKTQKGQDLLMNSPSVASAQQLKELGIKIDYESLKEERKAYLLSSKSFEERTF